MIPGEFFGVQKISSLSIAESFQFSLMSHDFNVKCRFPDMQAATVNA